MYRPPGEPQLRPRAVVPPPPPPGMANYAPPRPLPPPLHGRPFTTSQFSYSLPGQSFQMQPSSGLHVPSFVPPLPSDLPPPPPSSPPPSPPPLPSESVVGPTKHPGHSGSNETPLKTDTFLRDSGYGMLNHQESSLPRAEKNQVSLSLDPRKIVEQRQQDSVWNATYQDTLDEEAGSASDMDMDLEDHLGINITRAAVDGELKSGPTHYRPSIEIEKEDDRSNDDGLGLWEGKMNADSGVYDARTADQSKASLSARGLAKEHQASRGNEDEQLKHDLFREDVLEQGSVFRSQTSMLNKECPRARSSRWGSPTWVHNEDENHDLLTACSGNLEHLSSSCNTNNNTSRNWQPRFSPADGSLNFEVPASVERTIEVPEDPQRQDSASQMANQSSKIDIRSNSVLQGEKQDPKVDEFGRLVQEGVSDSESEGYRLPMVESGRASRKGGSASNSEEDRRSLKRKRRYSRSRSRSRSRASSGSRSRSRSRSRSSTSRSRGSRTPTRSPGERRWRRRSFSRSPRRKPRWNRSRSRSPYMRRSYSRTPPRDSRRRVVMSRGERDWRGDRDYFGRGRRAVRGSGASTCFHYARGRCLRGSSCRFLHVNRDSPMQDRGGWWRDDQFERHSFRDEDGVQESHMIDRQDRQKLAREPWSERHDGWDSSGQDGVGERQRRGTVSSAKILPQEGGCIVGGELAADRFASPTPAKESWAPAESKGAQFLGSSDLREGYSGMPQTSMEREVGAAEQASSNLLKEWNVLELTDKMDNVIRDVELAAIKAGKDGLEEVGSRNKQGDTDSSEIEKEVVQEYGVEVRGDERLGTNGDMDIVDDMKLSPDTGEQGPKQEIGASGDGAMAVPEMPGNYNGNVKLEPIDEGGVSRDTSSLGEKAVETAAKADPSMETQVGVSRDSSSLEEQAVECATKADAMESQAGEGLSLFRLPLNSKEGGPHVVLEEVVEEPMLGTAGVLMKAEVSQSLPVGTIAPMKPSAPQAQEIPAGHPASLPAMPPPVAPLLPTPVGQHNICIGQPVFTQGQQHTPIGQSYPRQLMGSTQHGVLARNLPHATPYGSSYRLPSSVPASNLGDQVTGQMSKLNSGGTGYLAVAGGWGQLGFHPRAPGQEITPFSQAQGHPNYGRPSLGPQPFGVSFFGIPPNSADQVTKHHGQPNAAEQFPQHHGPGFGQPIPGVPISQQQQHGLSSDMAASFSQHHLAPLQLQAPFPLQHPPSQIHRPLSHGGAPYLPYVHPQPGSSQISTSTQQAGHMNQYATTPTVSTIPPPPFLSTQQGVSSTSSLPTEQPHPSGGAALSQFHATTFMNPAFAASVAPSQSSIPWNYAATQGSVLPSKGQSYAYPLTTIPPLSSLVQVPQTTNPSSQNNQYDPLSDIPGSDGSPKHSVKAPEAAISTGGTTTAASAQPLFTRNANAHTDIRTGETTVPLAAPLDPSMKVNGADTKSTTEAATDAENLSPENWSPGQPAEGTEPGQEQQALSKKSSRGLKMLRAAIAEHVKEVLKPTWKEGYMSKEAFKTIAKKAVEKVIGNVPSHHIPKTQEKVDQYMKASRPKISKLVQGYVDKYLKL